MLNPIQFRELVIRPSLRALGLYSPQAEELLLGTAIQESRLVYLKQLGGGPALGLFQMEPATHDDIWDNYLKYHPALGRSILGLSCSPELDAGELVWNLLYATAMTRVHYLRVPEALPAEGDIDAQAVYWKEYYNTYLGSGTEEEYTENWYTYSGE